MPIRPENKHRYPRNWKEISHRIRFGRASGRCECTGECGRGHSERCPNIHGHENFLTGSRIVLTTAHLNHTPEDCRDENLRAFCQACHLAYDGDHHKATAAATRRAELERQMDPLFDLPQDPPSCDTERTSRRSGQDPSSRAAPRQAPSAPCTPSAPPADRMCIPVQRPTLSHAAPARAQRHTPASRSTCDYSGHLAYAARQIELPLRRRHAARSGPRASGSTVRASWGSRTRPRRKGLRPHPFVVVSATADGRAAAGSNALRTSLHWPCFGRDCRSSRACTCLPFYAMCQGCHLHYDLAHHAETRAATKRAELEASMDTLFKEAGR